MFGGEAIGAIILLLLALFASLVLALALGFVALILWRKRKRRTAAYVSLPVLCLVLAWIGIYFYFSPPKKKPYTIRFSADPASRFQGFPAGRALNVRPGLTEHQIWGLLTVEIHLPDGKIVQGKSDRLIVMDTTNGLAYFTLFYKPAVPDEELFQYWTESGKLNESSVPGRRVQVDRQGYSLELLNCAPTQDGYQLEVRFPEFKLIQPAAYWGVPQNPYPTSRGPSAIESNKH